MGKVLLDYTGLMVSLACLFCVLFALSPEATGPSPTLQFRLSIYLMLVLAFVFSAAALTVRRRPAIGFIGLWTVMLGSLACRALPPVTLPNGWQGFADLDGLLLNAALTAVLFIPLEKLVPLKSEQDQTHHDWREDLLYYLVTSVFTHLCTYLFCQPTQLLVQTTQGSGWRASTASQPLMLQLLEIMLVYDFLQYWCHRAFHTVPALWKIHAIHHSLQSVDWMAGARLHCLELLTRCLLILPPMQFLGFSSLSINIYLLLVYFHSTVIHANIRISPRWLDSLIVTPRFHRWHHGIEREAVNINYSNHFPWLDKLFGTFHLPDNQWPKGYGIEGHPVPKGYLAQLLYPFRASTPPDRELSDSFESNGIG